MPVLRKALIQRTVAGFLIAAIFITGWMPSDLSAAVLSPDTLIASDILSRDSALQQIRTVLESKMVRQRLADLGLSASEIQAKLGQLSDQQIRQLSTQMDSIIAGGDDLGVIVFLLVIAILVVILLQLTGHKIIITK